MFYIFVFIIGIVWLCWQNNISVKFPITRDDTVLITGACMRLGKTLAIECAKQKLQINIIGISDQIFQQIYQETLKEKDAIFYSCDLSHLKATKKLIEIIKKKHKITTLISSGIGIFKHFHDEMRLWNVQLRQT